MSLLRHTAARCGGAEAENGEFHFACGQDAIRVIAEHGSVVSLPTEFETRSARLRQNKRGNISIVVNAQVSDPTEIKGWVKKKNDWTRTTDAPVDARTDDEFVAEFDPEFRATRNLTSHQGWYFRAQNDNWVRMPSNEIRLILRSRGLSHVEIDSVMGKLAHNSWLIVNRPFAPEYPQDEPRTWNKDACQHRYQPSEIPGNHPTWDAILHHCGQDLDEAIRDLEWAKRAGIRSGGDYLLAWTASLLRYPDYRLPYIFLFGGQDCGKTSFGKAIGRLISGGAVSGDRALTSDYNGELANAVLCTIEETDLQKSPGAYARLKTLVTDDILWVRRMHTDLYSLPNFSHWVQSANDRSCCPLDFDDTRITVAHVAPLAKIIEPDTLTARLDLEAPAFMRTIMDLTLPPATGRLRIPVVSNATKQRAAECAVAPFVSAVADRVAERGELRLTCATIEKELGSGPWPKSLVQVKRLVESDSAFLRHRHITVDFPKIHTKYGTLFVVRRID
jgi:hypothetical protein